MKAELSKILDECITRISKGEAIQSCLTEYPAMRQKLKPWLDTALFISALPQASPSDDFRKKSKARLMARLRQESAQTRTTQIGGLALVWQQLSHAFTGARRVAIPITIAVILALTVSLALPGTLNIFSPTPVMAVKCTLSILSGSTEFQSPGADTWQEGTDGTTLETGSQVRTAPDSHALLTFYEGSTIRLQAK